MVYWIVPVIVVVLGIVIYAIVRMGREDEMEAGGSYGDQLGGKSSDKES
jgi:cytochrome c-type biogenesis protein CcmH/NrfF